MAATAGRAVEPIDADRLAEAIVNATRSRAKRTWPWLKGDGWPAYAEHRAAGDITQVFVVNEIAADIAEAYAELGD